MDDQAWAALRMIGEAVSAMHDDDGRKVGQVCAILSDLTCPENAIDALLAKEHGVEGDNPSGKPPVMQVPDDLLRTLGHSAERYAGSWNTWYVSLHEDDWNKIVNALGNTEEFWKAQTMRRTREVAALSADNQELRLARDQARAELAAAFGTISVSRLRLNDAKLAVEREIRNLREAQRKIGMAMGDTGATCP